MDKTGHWAIKPQFEGVSAFSEGLGLVRLRSFREREFNLALNDFAYVDKSGKTVFELKNYFDAAPFHEGLARVTRRPGKVAFVERTGSVLFELESDNVVDFSGGRAAVLDTKTKTYGYIDRSGKWVIPPKYAAAHPFADGLAIVCSYPDTCVYINPQGTVISGDAEDKYINGLSLQYLHTRTIGPTASFRNIYGYRDKSGKYVWVSPGGEIFFGKKWWRENYKGPHMPTTFSRP